MFCYFRVYNSCDVKKNDGLKCEVIFERTLSLTAMLPRHLILLNLEHGNEFLEFISNPGQLLRILAHI